MDRLNKYMKENNTTLLRAYLDVYQDGKVTDFCDRLTAVNINGESQSLAVQSVCQWASGVKPIPPAWMPSIEKASSGKVSRKLMHKGWRSLWPELAND